MNHYEFRKLSAQVSAELHIKDIHRMADFGMVVIDDMAAMVRLEALPEPGCLTLQFDLGDLPSDRQMQTLTSLMRLNLSVDDPGAVFGLSEDGTGLVYAVRMASAHQQSPASLAQRFRGCAARARQALDMIYPQESFGGLDGSPMSHA
jgi:hypothetical protein